MTDENLAYPEYTEDGKVFCQICGKGIGIITPSHLKTHGVTLQQYRTRFPSAPIVGTRSREKQRATWRYRNTQILKANEPDMTSEPVEPIVVEEEPREVPYEPEQPQEKRPGDPIRAMKKEVLGILREFFPNIEENFFIEQTSGGILRFRHITDFCDPVLRVVVEFPTAFWHNRETIPDMVRYTRLEQYGWKVIVIDTPSFAPETLRNIIQNAFK